jgi:pimeloyl-ACP methyl ester carboxylesterase
MSKSMTEPLAYDVQGTSSDGTPLVLLHGLTFDRRHWRPVLRELAAIDPGRRVLTVDLPGHGDAPRWERYDLESVVAAVHTTAVSAGFDEPVVVGHSIGGLLATIYAAKYPARAVVNVDQPLLPGPFGAMIRWAETVLRGPSFLDVWQELLDGMGIELLPADAQELVHTATTPRADLLLGYWAELLADEDGAVADRRTRELAELTERGVRYHLVAHAEPPQPYRQWLESALSAPQTTVLPGGGHFPHLAHPARLAQILTDLAVRAGRP